MAVKPLPWNDTSSRPAVGAGNAAMLSVCYRARLVAVSQAALLLVLVTSHLACRPEHSSTTKYPSLEQVTARGGSYKFDANQTDVVSVTLRKVADAVEHDLMFLTECSRITELHLSGTRLGDAHWRQVAALRMLQSLHVDDTTLSDSAMQALAEASLPLRRLSARGTAITDASIPGLARLTSLESVDLTQTNISPAGIATLRRLLPQTAIRSDELRPWTHHDSLVLDRQQQSTVDEWLAADAQVYVDRQGQVRHLRGYRTPFPVSLFESLSDLPSIEKLEFFSVPLTSAHLSLLSRLKRLREIHLCDVSLPDDELLPLAQVDTLEIVRIDSPEVTGEHLEWLAQLPRLVTLELHGRQVTDHVLRHVGQAEKLEYLDLRRTGISNAGLAAIGPLVHLRTLNLWETAISDQGLVGLQQAHQLEELNLLETDISDQGLPALRSLQRLRVLQLRGPSITDAALPTLLALSNLEELNLLETQLTDQGLLQLQALSRLRKLHVGNTRVTMPGVEKLRLANPQLEIDY